MRSTLLTAAAALGLACAAGAASAQEMTVKPGMWTYDMTVSSSMEMNGETMPVPDRTESSEECISEEDATLNPKEMAQEGCDVSGVQGSANQVSFDMTCSQAGFVLTGVMNMSKNADGTQTSGNFNLTGTGRGMVMEVNGKVKGRRTGDC
mgnify:CR=1 FL=1